MSENAKAVAKEVMDHVRKGSRVNLGKIIKKHGYGPSISTHPKKVTSTKAYQKEIRPLLDRLDEERNRAIAMLKKKIPKAKYRDLIDALDKITKNHQVLVCQLPSQNSYRRANCITRGPPLPLSATAFKMPADVSL